MRTSGPISAGALALLISTGAGLAGCGNAATRSTSQFCGELTAHAIQIQTPPTNVDEIPALITLYSKMGEVAPLEIEADWETLYGILKTAAAVDASDPASVQAVADAAYGGEHAATKVVQWAQDNCGVTLDPVGIVPGGAPIEPPTTATSVSG
jgi:hypothetical protein